MSDCELPLLLALIDRAYDKKSWHGTNLRGSLRGLSLDVVCFRPGPGRKNIWEITLHAAYWKYTVRRTITGEKQGSFPLKGSNWFERPVEKTERAWRADVKLLDDTHKSLRRAIAGLDTGDLRRPIPKSKYTLEFLITGVASHDLYHAGQIQLLKRLARS